MPPRLGALHDALMHPGDPDLAQKAAEEVANYENRIARVERDLTVLKWMVGTHIALTIAGFSILAQMVLRVLERVS